jgi:ABC-type multidrug transport system fused ATPase/permease subunit
MKNKILQLLNDIKHVSKTTSVGRKKARILFSVILTNITVGIDIVVIIIFSTVITNQTQDNMFSFVVDFVLERKILLPFLVLLRFIVIYFEKMNIQSLVLQVQENLKMYLIKEIYKKGNFSIADVTFYSNTLSMHISFFYSALTNLLNNLVQLTVYSTFLLITDLETFGILFLGALLLAYPTKKLLGLGRYYMHKSYVITQELGKNMQRIVDNIFLIKILKTSNSEFQEYNENIKKANRANYNNYKYGAINSLIPNFLTLFVFSLIIAFFTIGKRLTLEFIAVVLRIVQTIGTINTSLNNLINSQVHIERFRLLEEDIPNANPGYLKIDHDHIDNSADLENISFKYFESNLFIFEDINIQIPKNKHTVITGPNGSGKSTLLGLIAGILIPETGSIKLSSDKFGYVGVTPLIISGSLRENLTYGNKNELEDAEIYDMIHEFKLFNENENISLDLQVTNKSLSSGQMQKVSFIRALLSDLEILLLDESTSNLDANTRELIFGILNKKEITIINSTHNKDDFNYDNHLKIEIIKDKRVFKQDF